jgi:hypothetical protein
MAASRPLPAGFQVIVKESEMKNPCRWAVWLLISALTISLSVSADEHRKKGVEGARLYIISPANGAKVKSPVTVQFGLSGMGVAPAGVAKEKTGHHHILIDTEAKDVDMNQPLPASEKIKHFGGGQTETKLELSPGKHTLQMIMGDENHVPFDPPLMSEKITIKVQ